MMQRVSAASICLRLLLTETRCIYCDKVPSTLEHMPPRSMFRQSQRLCGMEFACCKDCNNGTRGADVVAAFFSRLDPHGRDLTHWRHREAKNLIPMVRKRAPGIIETLFDDKRAEHTYIKHPSGLLEPTRRVVADCPALHAHLAVFGAKFGMALFREHTGAPLPMTGMVFTRSFLNQGMAEDAARVILSKLPNADTLRQGRQSAGDQFAYAYNTDEKEIVAALAYFHHGLQVFTVTTSKPEFDGISKVVEGTKVRPGELAAMLHAVGARA